MRQRRPEGEDIIPIYRQGFMQQTDNADLFAGIGEVEFTPAIEIQLQKALRLLLKQTLSKVAFGGLPDKIGGRVAVISQAGEAASASGRQGGWGFQLNRTV